MHCSQRRHHHCHLAESFLSWRLKRSVQLWRVGGLKMAVKSKKEKEHLNLVLGSHLATIHETLQVIITSFLSVSLYSAITISQHIFLRTLLGFGSNTAVFFNQSHLGRCHEDGRPSF